VISRTVRRFWDCYDALPDEIKLQAMEAFALWQSDPYNRTLEFKRIRRTLHSVRIGNTSYRAMGRKIDATGDQTEDTVVWHWNGSHTEYDRFCRARGSQAVQDEQAERIARGTQRNP